MKKFGIWNLSGVTAIAMLFGAGPFIKFTRARGQLPHIFSCPAKCNHRRKRARQITLPLQPVLVPMILTPNLALMLLAWDHIAKLWQFFDLPRGTCISLINVVYSRGCSAGSNHSTYSDNSLHTAARDKDYVRVRDGNICSFALQDGLQLHW
jgi:hypothetical protein